MPGALLGLPDPPPASPSRPVFVSLPRLTVSRITSPPPRWSRPLAEPLAGGHSPRSGERGDRSMSSTAEFGAVSSKVRCVVPTKPLISIEETLRKRRTLQKASSAPHIAAEPEEARGEPDCSVPRTQTAAVLQVPREAPDQFPGSAWHGVVSGRQRIDLPTELEGDDTEDFVAWYQHRELQKRKAQLTSAAWDRPPSGGAHPTASASFPSAGSSGLRRGSGGIGSKKVLPARSQPIELTRQIKDRGWTQVRQTKVWAQQAKDQGEYRASLGQGATSIACDRAIHDRLRLLDHLEQANVPQGMGAMLLALRFRCGRETANCFACLGSSASDSARGISLMEFVGGLALLGIDAVSLCGFDEREALQRLDADRDGLLGIADLTQAFVALDESGAALGAVVAMQPTAGNSSNGVRMTNSQRWLLVARFVALSAWFHTPPHLRRRARRAGAMLERPANNPSSATLAAPVPSVSPSPGCSGAVAFAAAEAIRGGAESPRAGMARQEAPDSHRNCWVPNELDHIRAKQLLEGEFVRHATTRQFGERLLGRPDLVRLLADVSAAEVGDAHLAELLNKVEVGKIYDEVMTLQANITALEGRQLSKGLTFDSLRVALYHASSALGLHFRHLVDDAVDHTGGSIGPEPA